MDLINNRNRVTSLDSKRNRTFMNKFSILNEAQNRALNQMKSLITRPDSGTKVVCLGNITLHRGERSRLKHQAAEVLLSDRQ